MSHEMLEKPIELTDAELDEVCGGLVVQRTNQTIQQAAGAVAGVAAIAANVGVQVGNIGVNLL